MAEPRTCEEIGRRLEDLAGEYTRTAKEDPRHTEIENEISALSLERYILQKLLEHSHREH